MKRHKPSTISRRTFTKAGGASLVGLSFLTACGSDADSDDDDDTLPADGDGTDNDTDGDEPHADGDEEQAELENPVFRIAVLADTHIIDEFYEGPEGNTIDSESIMMTVERLTACREHINSLSPTIEMVHICGDVIHNYPSKEYEFFQENRTRWDVCKELLDGFNCPVNFALGNHDYNISGVPREFTHQLFKEKFGIDPYYSVDYKGWKFIYLNHFLGTTCDHDSPIYNEDRGSFGQEQLQWLDDELSQGMPSILFWHYPLAAIAETEEDGPLDLRSVILAHLDSVKLTLAGHMHMWWDAGSDEGFPHWLCSSTRYDEDAAMFLDLNSETGEWSILNEDDMTQFDFATEPFDGE